MTAANDSTVTLIRPSPGLERLHDALLVSGVFMRVTAQGLDYWSQAQGAITTLAVAGLALVLLQGLRRQGRAAWSLDLVLGALVLVLAVPAVTLAADQALALGRWSAWGSDLLLVAYALQVLPGRRRLLWAALAGGLAVQCGLAMMQAWWVHPLLRARPEMFPTDLRAEALERLRNGGAFGSFDLANNLANFLVLLIAPLAGIAWQARRHLPQLTAWLLLIAGAVVTMFLAGSKAAPAALLAAAGLIWALHGAWWRWPLLALAAATVALPPVWEAIAPSFMVRLGYWQGAWDMILARPLSGWGLDGFAVHGPAWLPLRAEPARHVHNLLLGSWVAGGALLLVPVLSLLALVVIRCLLGHEAPGTTTWGARQSVAGWSALLPVALLPYLVLLGELGSDNLVFWPGGGALGGRLGYALLLALPAAGAALTALRCRPPPNPAIAAGLLAATLQWLVDYSLVNASIVGAAALVALELLPSGARRSLPPVPLRIVAAATMPALLLALLAWQLTAGRLRDLDAGLQELARLQTTGDPLTAAMLAERVGRPAPTAVALDDPRRRRRLAAEAAVALHRQAGRWPVSLHHQRSCLPWMPIDRAQEALSALLRQHPEHQALHASAAALAKARGRPSQASDHLRQAIERAPAVLEYRYRLWRLSSDGRERRRLAEEILALQERVHARNRLDPAQVAELIGGPD